MNNFVYGNEVHQNYETICGGTGAGKGFDGASAVHSHMTNTRMTDPEGENLVQRASGKTEILAGNDACEVRTGDICVIMTPGADGYGSP